MDIYKRVIKCICIIKAGGVVGVTPLVQMVMFRDPSILPAKLLE